MGRRTATVLATENPAEPSDDILHIGEFIISKEGDPQLSGHPDIRY
jgi:hypothetical protein